jgi:hypothetical protein
LILRARHARGPEKHDKPNFNPGALTLGLSRRGNQIRPVDRMVHHA